MSGNDTCFSLARERRRGGPDRDALSSQTAACRHHAWEGLHRQLANRCTSPHRRPLGRCLHSDSHSQNSSLCSAPGLLAMGPRGTLGDVVSERARPSRCSSQSGGVEITPAPSPTEAPALGHPSSHRDEPCGNYAA